MACGCVDGAESLGGIDIFCYPKKIIKQFDDFSFIIFTTLGLKRREFFFLLADRVLAVPVRMDSDCVTLSD